MPKDTGNREEHKSEQLEAVYDVNPWRISWDWQALPVDSSFSTLNLLPSLYFKHLYIQFKQFPVFLVEGELIRHRRTYLLYSGQNCGLGGYFYYF